MKKNKFEFIIDSEFQSQIPALTDEEFQQLEENILSEGEVLSPLIVWGNILVDGPHRAHRSGRGCSSGGGSGSAPPARSPAPAKPVKMFWHGSASISWVVGI